MIVSENGIRLSEDDLKEIFALFCSATRFEKLQVYDEQSDHYFHKVQLSEEYSLTEEPREFALDAWRAVISFLNSKGYSLSKDGRIIRLSFSDDEFID
jgi:hypothetical protein